MGKQLFNIYVISDTHFGHWNIIEHAKRPFLDLKEMDKKITCNWNSIVRPQDLVICLGDFVWTGGASEKIKDYIKALNGRIILVAGNHCKKSYSWYMSNGVQFVCDRFVWEFNKKRILFIHDYNNVSVEERKKYNYVLHGHAHQNLPLVRMIDDVPFVNVSVENIAYKPMNLITLLSRLTQGYYAYK